MADVTAKAIEGHGDSKWGLEMKSYLTGSRCRDQRTGEMCALFYASMVPMPTCPECTNVL